jgi:PAS domain S-box-containing protein
MLHRELDMAGKPDQDTTDGAPQPRRAYERLNAKKRSPQGAPSAPGYPVRHETLFESITDGFFVLDKEWRCTYINQIGAASFGATPERLIGNPFWDVLPNVSRARCREQYTRAVERQVIVKFEDYYEPFERWYEYRCRPTRDGLTVFFIDITDRKQMESKLLRLNERLEEEVKCQTEEMAATIDRLQDEVARRVLAEGRLRKRSQMLEAFFRHTITPLAFLDRSFNFVRVNDAYAKADGKTPEYFVGRNHFLLYPDAQMRETFEQVVQTRQTYRAFARPFTYPDGPARMRYWNWQLTPLLSEAGDVKFLVFNLEDVTDQQHAIQELRERAHQLQKLALELSQAEDRERKRLAEILHDDLQQVLAAAKFHLGMMNTRIRGDTEMEDLAVQIDALLKEAIGKSRSLSHELSPAVLYQSDLGETFEWLARQLESKHGLTVHVEIRGHIDPQSEPLRAFLYRAAQEILFNVVKHARVEEARLRLQRIGHRVWLTISDRGRGFDPRALRRAGGFGLLSIHERVQLLGGRMRIRSITGKGSTFLISVPDAEIVEDSPHAAQDASCEQPDVPYATHHGPCATSEEASFLRVLLVDDHKVVREGLAALLKAEQDIDVIAQAANGLEAIALAKRLRPDVIVMDVAMPVMAGEEATRHIKEHLPRTRVIALSMYEEASVAEKMHRAGAETYLLKTSPAEELLAAVRGIRRDVNT